MQPLQTVQLPAGRLQILLHLAQLGLDCRQCALLGLPIPHGKRSVAQLLLIEAEIHQGAIDCGESPTGQKELRCFAIQRAQHLAQQRRAQARCEERFAQRALLPENSVTPRDETWVVNSVEGLEGLLRNATQH